MVVLLSLSLQGETGSCRTFYYQTADLLLPIPLWVVMGVDVLVEIFIALYHSVVMASGMVSEELPSPVDVNKPLMEDSAPESADSPSGNEYEDVRLISSDR